MSPSVHLIKFYLTVKENTIKESVCMYFLHLCCVRNMKFCSPKLCFILDIIIHSDDQRYCLCTAYRCGVSLQFSGQFSFVSVVHLMSLSTCASQ
jgi:hypothetical protein